MRGSNFNCILLQLNGDAIYTERTEIYEYVHVNICQPQIAKSKTNY